VVENWTPAERDYSPSTCLDDAVTVDALLTQYRTESERARAAVPPQTYDYGSLPSERVDVFAAGPGSPAHVFVHGGYWQELSKDDSSFPAPAFVARGITYLAVDYGLAPGFTLDQIVAQVRTAIAWIYAHADDLGIDPTQVVVSGSSAGAHLAAMAAVASVDASTDRPQDGVPAGAISGLVLMSGIYDLDPLVDTYINDAVGMDRETAMRNSPLRYVPRANTRSPAGPPTPPVPTIVTWGEHETDAFKRQSARFADAWQLAGHQATRLEAAGRNHFDIVHDLADPATPLGAEVARLHEAVRSSR
jgi:arylformamidase